MARTHRNSRKDASKKRAEHKRAVLATLALKRYSREVSEATGVQRDSVTRVLEESLCKQGSPRYRATIDRLIQARTRNKYICNRPIHSKTRPRYRRVHKDSLRVFTRSQAVDVVTFFSTTSIRAQDNEKLVDLVLNDTPSTGAVLRASDLLTRLIAELGSDEAARTFLESPSEDLDGKTPLSFVKKHGLDALEKLVVWEETAAYA